MKPVVNNTGFTLLELLVVISIIAIMATVTGIYSRKDNTDIESIARILMADLRHERSKALVSGIDSALIFDLTDNHYTSFDSTTSRQLGGSIKIALLLDSANINSGGGTIIFYPDGSSSGGKIILTANGKTIEVTTSWLNGYVAIHDEKRKL